MPLEELNQKESPECLLHLASSFLTKQKNISFLCGVKVFTMIKGGIKSARKM